MRQSAELYGGSSRQRWRDVSCGLSLGICMVQTVDKRVGSCCFYWSFCCDGLTESGRDLQELADFFVELSEAANGHFLVFVQDTAEFFQYFRKYCDPIDLFAAQPRTPLNAEIFPGVHIRSADQISGMSLQENVIRFSTADAPLRGRPRSYEFQQFAPGSALPLDAAEMIDDEARAMQLLCRSHIERCKGKPYHVPLTKIGYVRKLLRNMILYGTGEGATKKDWYRAAEYRAAMRGATMCPEEYRILKAASCAGICEPNVRRVGEIILDPIYSDRKSAYPAHIVYDYVPIGRGKYTKEPAMDRVRAISQKRCFVGVFRFRNIRARNLPAYYLREKYCTAICDPVNMECVRKYLKRADEVTVSLTELDLACVDECYLYDNVECLEIVTYLRGQIPSMIKKYVLLWFRGKESAGTKEDRRVMKEMLNSIFGIMVMDPLREAYVYNIQDAEWDEPAAPDIEEGIEAYNKSNSRFTCYPWGIWIAAQCRRTEWQAWLELSPWFIYGDTDSVYLSSDGWAYIRTYFEEQNAKMYQRALEVSKQLGVGIEFFKPFGVLLGTWQIEETISRFCMTGQKQYITESKAGELKVVIAGINPELSGTYIKRKYGGNAVEAFRSVEYYPARWRDKETGQIFSATGRRICFHFDKEFSGEIIDALGERQQVCTPSGQISMFVPVKREDIQKYEEAKADAGVDVIPEILS